MLSEMSRSDNIISASCGYGWVDLNVNVACGGIEFGAESTLFEMMVGGGADSVRTGETALIGFDVVGIRLELCDL